MQATNQIQATKQPIIDMLQGVSWELTKIVSFKLNPGGIPEAKMGCKQFFKYINFDNRL